MKRKFRWLTDQQKRPMEGQNPMKSLHLAGINSCPYPAAQTVDQTIITRILEEHQELRELVLRLQKENQESKDRTLAQEREISFLNEQTTSKVAALEREIKTLQTWLEQSYKTLAKTLAETNKRLDSLEITQEQSYEAIVKERADDRKRIAALENRSPEPTKKTLNHIDELHRIMAENKTLQVSVALAAKLLGLTKERVRQLKPLILGDGRFDVGWDRLRGQRSRVILKIKQYIIS